MKPFGKRVQRGLVRTVVCGVLLVMGSFAVWSPSMQQNRAARERAACKLLSFIPEPGSGAFESIAIQKSTLSALSKSGNESLESVARAFDKAAIAQNSDAMIRALDDGVGACHRMGLKTAS